MANRNFNRTISRNNTEMYRALRKARDRELYIDQFRAPIVDYPSKEQQKEMEYVRHIWKVGDRYYKLAHEYYGDSRYWWVIALFNKKPTENHVKLGTTVYIPQPLDRILLYAGVRDQD